MMSFESIPEDKQRSYPCDCGGNITLDTDSNKWACDACDFERDEHEPDVESLPDHIDRMTENQLRKDIRRIIMAYDLKVRQIQELVSALQTFADETGTAERQLAAELVKRYGGEGL